MRTRKVTIKDIATEAGVSIALVSFVMNNKADGKETYRVNKETAQRILEVAEKLNYQPNNAARTLRSGKTNTIGVIVSDISNKFFADIARCIETAHINISIPYCSAVRTKIRRNSKT
ncbi:MAG: LacI family DNA-binding transcriptional regulator [Alistipes onderdonkii]